MIESAAHPAVGERPRRALGRPAAWALLGVALTFALRAGWLDAPLSRDEGGDTFIAQSWHHSGPFAYGSYFLDRPPLLLLLYRVAADAGGVTGIRVLGAIAAVTLVAVSTVLAARAAGPRAAPVTALVAALLASSLALWSVYTPAELLAAVPAAASVLLVVVAVERGDRGRLAWAGAGLLAAVALLVKQSFGDALAAGAVALLVCALGRGVTLREAAARAGAYLTGLAVAALALFAWMWLAGVSAHSMYYALIGFRLDAAAVLARGGDFHRLSRLGRPLLESGLAVGLPLAAAGIALVRTRPAVRAALVAWLLAGVVGIALGGSYWPHYLIQLAAVTAVGAGALFQRGRRLPAATALVLVAVPPVVTTIGPIVRDSGDRFQARAVTVGHYVRARALPGQSDYVLYARADVLYYSGLPDPYPYNWSLMVRAIPHAQPRLNALLASRRRPTWIVKWTSARSLGIDRRGTTARLLAAHYRQVATVCGHAILLARGARARPAPRHLGICANEEGPG
ncbi:MAG: hypothetical protein IRZ21_05955 [Thermoleophilaceae bacterium]|nr:hypothetical protein [Thermoleophilaceae bacterium]